MIKLECNEDTVMKKSSPSYGLSAEGTRGCDAHVQMNVGDAMRNAPKGAGKMQMHAMVQNMGAGMTQVRRIPDRGIREAGSVPSGASYRSHKWSI